MKRGAALATSPVVRGLAVIWRSARQRPVIQRPTARNAMCCTTPASLETNRTHPPF